MTSFSPPIDVVAGLAGLLVAYLLCVRQFQNRFPNSKPVSGVRQAMFVQGVITLYLALATPLHVLAEQYLFTAHMVQHLLVVLVAAPLLLAGTPDWLMAEVLRVSRLARVARFLLHPLIAYFAFNLVFMLAHLPAVYELALATPSLHAVEHLVFLLTALVLWMPILSPLPALLPRYPYLAQLLYLFFQTVPSMLLGGLIVAAGRPLYATYALAPRIVESLPPLADQQLGGLIMWVGGSFYFLAATGIVFFVWANREEASNRRPLGAAS